MNNPVVVYKIEVMALGLNRYDPLMRMGDPLSYAIEFSTVMDVQVRVVDWTDEHPLNVTASKHAAYEELFGIAEARQLAERIVHVAEVDGNTHEYGAEATQLARFVLGSKR